MSFLTSVSRKSSVADRTSLRSVALGVERTSSPLIGYCSNPGCRSAWLQLFRQRTRPIFEAGWTCSRECTEERLQIAVRRELDGRVQLQETHRHRIPLGLLMLEKGWITSSQLRRAVEEQRESGSVRLGEWLVRQGAADEATVTRALGMQWGCPVLSLRSGLVGRNQLLPRLFVEAFGALPLQGPSGKTLYLGFEEKVDRALAYSVERMEGAKVECGVVQSSTFADTLRTREKQCFPPVQMAEATSAFAAAHVLAKSIERTRPISSRLVRVHDWLWMRMIREPEGVTAPNSTCISDVLCRVGSF